MRADSAGFLIGDGARVDLSAEQERLQLLRAIKADTAAMRAVLTQSAGMRSAGKLPLSSVPLAPPPADALRSRRERQAANTLLEAAIAIERAASARSRTARQPEALLASDSSVATPTTQSQVPPGKTVVSRAVEALPVATPNRSANGRFISAGQGLGADGAEARRGLQRTVGRLGTVADKLRESVAGMVSGTEQVDPAIAAAKEVGDLVSPLTRPFKGMLGWLFKPRDQSAKVEKEIAVPWYRRLWTELRGINQKTGTSGRGNMLPGALAGAGRLLGMVPGLRLLLGMGSGALRRGGGLLGAGASMLGRSVLRRIPLLGGVIGGGQALAGLLGVGDQTRDERFKNSAGGLGMLLGGGLGAVFGGPVGAVLGASIGEIVGDKVGAWLATVDWENVSTQITGAWDRLTGKIGDGWDWLLGRFDGVLGGVRKWFADASGKAKALGTQAVDAAKEAAAPAIKKLKQGYETAKEAAIVGGGRLAGRLDKGFRHKESFAGIQGGDKLAKYGLYTNTEAERIRELKSSGANTSANLKGGMPLTVRNKIITQAQAAGLDPQSMLEIAAVESGGNPNAVSSTGAIGVYQMVGGTASGLGITDRFDVDQNIAGAMKLAQENAASLRKSGLPVTRDTLYMMHQLGPSAAREIIRGAADGKQINQLSPATQAAASLNVGKGSKTAADYMAVNSRALDARLGRSAATIPATLAKPSAAPSVRAVPSVATVAPSAERQTLPPVPSVPQKVASNESKGNAPVLIEAPLTQNLSDRGLAQAATGGIGMNLGER